MVWLGKLIPEHQWTNYLISTLRPEAHFTKGFCHRISNSIGSWFQRNAITGYRSATKVCAYHDSTEVMPCVKFHSYHFFRICIEAKRNLHRIWITIEKLFVKWAAEQYDRDFSDDILKCLSLQNNEWRRFNWNIFPGVQLIPGVQLMTIQR